MMYNIHAHTGEKCFFLNALKVSLSPASREGPFHVMFVRTLMDSESQDATEITSALADSRISIMKMMTLYMCTVVITIFLSDSPSISPSVVTMSTSRTTGVCIINLWLKNSAEHDERIKNYCHESLVFFRHSVDLEFDEEVMKPNRLTEAPDNAGLNPDIMKVSKWYQETTRKGDDDPHFSSSSRMSDASVETDWTSYQVREPGEDDEERFAMKIGDMLLPLLRRVPNPRIRDDRALHFLMNSDKMHRASSDDAYTQAWFDYSRSSVFPQSVRKTGTDNELFNVSTYQCSILLNKMVSFNRKSEFRKPEKTWANLLPRVKNSTSMNCHSSRNLVK